MRSTLGFASLVAIAIAPAAFAQVADGFIVYKVGGADDCPYHAIQDAIDAAAQHPGIDLVWIASDQSYSDQHVVVTDQDVIIEGGFTDCDDNDPGLDQTTINGTSGHSVFEIEGTSNVTISNLVITGAVMDSGHSGGGIYFGGNGSLSLQTTWVFNNTTGYGGGIDVSPSGPTTVSLLQGTTISGNTAIVSGGGVRIEGQTTLTSSSGPGEPLIYIAQNAALGQGDTGYGGGFEVIGPAVANISSVVDFNTAEYGGGMAIIGNGNGNAVVNVYATNPSFPPSVDGNQASATGGGVYLLPSISTFDESGAFLCAENFTINTNIAQNGSAIYSDTNYNIISGNGGGQIYMNDRASCSPPPGATDCAAGVLCNEVNDNVNEDVNAEPTDGATFLMQSGSILEADRFTMSGNQGSALLRVLTDAPGAFSLSTCLLVGNIVAHELIDATPGGDGEVDMEIDHCTMADNQIGAPFVMLTQIDNFYFHNNIVDQPGRSTLDYSGSRSFFSVNYNLATDITNLTGDGNSEGEPTFVDRSAGNYRQLPSSLGVDYAPAESGTDLDGQPRTVDLLSVPNGFGPMDIGPYEVQFACGADTIFCDGFGG